MQFFTTAGENHILLATASGMAIRFNEADARPMGRNSSGVRGIRLVSDDRVVGMVVAESESTLLTACANGYGKRTIFGAGSTTVDESGQSDGEVSDPDADRGSSTGRYRTQRRGGKGVRDIKTSNRNGPVIGIARVTDSDEVIMMTRRGKIQRIAASGISVIGRNTQGVRIMNTDSNDELAAVVRVPREENGAEASTEAANDAAPPNDSTEQNSNDPNNDQ